MRMMNESEVLLYARNNFEIHDDFDWYISPHRWTNLAADGGVTAFAESDAEAGVIQGATGATDNNEIMCRSTNEVALYQANYAFVMESFIQYTEANTDDANVAIGMGNAAGANVLLDDGGGAGSFNSAALIYKIDGGTVWRCYSRSGTGTAIDTVTVHTAGGANYQLLTIKGYATIGSTEAELTFYLDGQPMLNSDNKPFSHRLILGTPTEMRIIAGYVKAGSANSETLNIDRTYFGARRLQAGM